jgi:hypothetical protein
LLEGASRRSVGTALAIGFLLAVATVEVSRRVVGFPEVREFAASPAAVASAKLWLLVTSAFIVSGPPVLELTGVALTVALLIRLYGAGVFWFVAILGHVGSTLTAYAGVGLLWLVRPDAVEDVVERPDYGISGAWLAVFGALCVSAWQSLAEGRGGRWEVTVLVGSVGAAAIGLFAFPLLPGIEHLLAFLFGAGAILLYSRSRRPARPIHSTAGQPAR